MKKVIERKTTFCRRCGDLMAKTYFVGLVNAPGHYCESCINILEDETCVDNMRLREAMTQIDEETNS